MSKPTPNIALTIKEMKYLARACREMPDKDEKVIDILTEKFNAAARLAIIGETMFGENPNE